MIDLGRHGKDMIVDGFGVIFSGLDSNGQKYRACLLDDNGFSGAFGVTMVDHENASIYHYTTLNLVDGFAYKLTGECNPSNGVVYVTPESEIDPDNIKQTIFERRIGETTTGAGGYFEFSNIDGSNGRVYVWAPVPASFNAVVGGLSCIATMLNNGSDDSGDDDGDDDGSSGGTDTPIVGRHPIGVTFTLGEDAEWQNTRVTITGTAPTDAVSNIYLSAGTFDANKIPMHTNSNAKCTASTEVAGGFTLVFGIAGEGIHEGYVGCLWCYTDDPDGTITITSMAYADAGCLSGDTLITMADGSEQRLDELRVGDMVMSQNGEGTPVQILKRGQFNDRHILYTFDNGTVIDETGPHRFYNVEQGFWQNLERWEIGEHALTVDGYETALVSKKTVYEVVEMFGIWTESGSYYANGLLSGTLQCNQPMLSDATAEQAVDLLASLSDQQMIELFDLGGLLP